MHSIRGRNQANPMSAEVARDGQPRCAPEGRASALWAAKRRGRSSLELYSGHTSSNPLRWALWALFAQSEPGSSFAASLRPFLKVIQWAAVGIEGGRSVYGRRIEQRSQGGTLFGRKGGQLREQFEKQKGRRRVRGHDFGHGFGVGRGNGLFSRAFEAWPIGSGPRGRWFESSQPDL